jgi:hypothetical protein
MRAEIEKPETLEAASKLGKAAPIMRKKAVITKVTTNTTNLSKHVSTKDVCGRLP